MVMKSLSTARQACVGVAAGPSHGGGAARPVGVRSVPLAGSSLRAGGTFAAIPRLTIAPRSLQRVLYVIWCCPLKFLEVNPTNSSIPIAMLVQQSLS